LDETDETDPRFDPEKNEMVNQGSSEIKNCDIIYFCVNLKLYLFACFVLQCYT